MIKRITDEESAVLAITNNAEIETYKKEDYISFLQTVIGRITNHKLSPLNIFRQHNYQALLLFIYNYDVLHSKLNILDAYDKAVCKDINTIK